MAKLRNYIGYGLHADRPPAGAPGALYSESDTGIIVRDNGTSWDIIARGPRAILHTAVPITLTRAHIFVHVSMPDITVTLPDPALWTGLEVTIKSGVGLTVNDPDATPADEHSQNPWNGISDGEVWWNTDY